MHDWRGTEIKVGSLVVYPGYAGSSQWVTEAEVVAIKEEKDSPIGACRGKIQVRRIRVARYGVSELAEGKLTWIQALERVTVVDSVSSVKSTEVVASGTPAGDNNISDTALH